MTTHELARRLLAGPDVLVNTKGYEGGYHEVTDVDASATLRLDVHHARGPYEVYGRARSHCAASTFAKEHDRCTR